MSFLGLVRENGVYLLVAMGKTLELTLLSLVFAAFIGLFFGLLNVSKNRILNTIANVYIDCIRGVPLIVLAFFVYFGIPMAIGARLDALTAGIISLSMNAGAYMAEIVRAGIQSIDKGQMEAARSLGLPYGKAMCKVVLPQAIRVMIPSIINQFIITLKDTSILSVIGFPELTNVGKTIVGNTYKSLQTWTIVGIMYMVVIVTLSKIAKQIERRVNRGR